MLAPWNFAGLIAFAVGFGAARLREEAEGSWTTTLEEWLPTLGLTREQWEGMLLPWAASLFSGSIEQARTLSARSAMISRGAPGGFDSATFFFGRTDGGQVFEFHLAVVHHGDCARSVRQIRSREMPAVSQAVKVLIEPLDGCRIYVLDLSWAAQLWREFDESEQGIVGKRRFHAHRRDDARERRGAGRQSRHHAGA